ncbi:MAG: peptidylprolyl isomerase [Gammaproteobacteria bacterium]|nr:peptidylprolyl isomerase [Gammaproteobacteria bacterium]
MHRPVKKFIFLSTILVAIHGAAETANTAREIPIDSIVAVVNKDVILKSELDKSVGMIKSQLSGKIELPPDEIIRKQMLERLIIERLQLDEADSYGVTVDDTTLNEDLQSLARHNQLTLEGLRQKLLKDGIDYETFRAERRKEITLQRLKQGLIGGRVRVSAAEVDEYLASQENENDNSEYLVSHIQISIPEDADSDTIKNLKNKADAIHARLLSGEDFAKIALAESDGRTALEGGSLGWHKLSELPKQFATELRNLSPGKITNPFQMSQGIHILKLVETKGIKRVIVKQVHARHILLATDKLNTDDQVRQQLNGYRTQILNGADFKKLAEEHSRDTGSAANGGDLGWAEPARYEPRFRKVVETLPVGKISQPFQSQYGWHIVEVLGWRDYDKTVDLARNTAYQDLYERKAMIEEDLWVRRLRSEAFVDIRPE